jgi:hypothetical protein
VESEVGEPLYNLKLVIMEDRKGIKGVEVWGRREDTACLGTVIFFRQS